MTTARCESMRWCKEKCLKKNNNNNTSIRNFYYYYNNILILRVRVSVPRRADTRYNAVIAKKHGIFRKNIISTSRIVL